MTNPILASLAARGNPSAKRALAKEKAARQKRSAPTPSALRAQQWGKPSRRLHADAVILRITIQHCACGAELHYANPDLLVRYSNSDSSTIQMMPHEPSLGNPDLPRLVEITHTSIPACPACFSPSDTSQLKLALTEPNPACSANGVEREAFRLLSETAPEPAPLSSHVDPSRFSSSHRSS